MWAWASIAIGLVIAAAALVGPPVIQSQKDLRAVRAKNAELESIVTNLKKELDAANQLRIEREGAVEEANSEIEKRQSEIERLSAEVERLKAELEKSSDKAAPNQQEDSTPSDNWQPQNIRPQ
jgi:septal ring factor EnvC (AmiA/AmiB activator)